MQNESHYNSIMALRKVGILTLLREVRIFTLPNTIIELLGTKWEYEQSENIFYDNTFLIFYHSWYLTQHRELETGL